MKLSAFAGTVIVAVTGGLKFGLAGAVIAGAAAAAAGLPMLFHDTPKGPTDGKQEDRQSEARR